MSVHEVPPQPSLPRPVEPQTIQGQGPAPYPPPAPEAPAPTSSRRRRKTEE